MVRAIAIATQKPYQEVYNDLFELNRRQHGKLRGASPRDGGTKKRTIMKYLQGLGWRWVPTMFIGSGCKVHVRSEELPKVGRYILNLSRHMSVLVDGKIYDTYDPSRGGTRCVYGYFTK